MVCGSSPRVATIRSVAVRIIGRPSRVGDSIGHWEGDMLIVDTIARTSEPIAPRAWLSFLSDGAHITERLRMVNRNELEDRLTIEVPIALAWPWHIELKFTKVPEMNRMIPSIALRMTATLSSTGK
jgi:hypothetical protein